jgi:hypothetical protein
MIGRSAVSTSVWQYPAPASIGDDVICGHDVIRGVQAVIPQWQQSILVSLSCSNRSRVWHQTTGRTGAPARCIVVGAGLGRSFFWGVRGRMTEPEEG